MANADRGREFLDRSRLQVIQGDAIDWSKYMHPGDAARVVPAESLLERGKARLLTSPEMEEGLSFPWNKTNGRVLIRPGKLAIWAGWTHHGKTQMLKQMMLHAMRSGERVLIASMEEELVEVWTDLAVVACGTEDPSPSDLDKFADFIRGRLWLYDQQGSVDARRIQAVVRYAAKELGVTQAVIDSLMMLQVDRDDYDAQRKFLSELHSTAKDTQCTTHLVCHMRKRDGKGGDENPGTVHDISGAHDIGSIADYVFLVWRNKKKDRKAEEPSAVLEVDKQRGRINWRGSIALNFHQSSRQFVEEHYAMRFLDD